MFKLNKITKIVIFAAVVTVAIASAPSQAEREQERKAKIEKISVDVLKINDLNVEDKLYAYKELSEYYENDETYKAEYKKYSYMDEAAQQCRTSSREKDKQSLINPNSYSGESNRFTKWISPNEVLTGSFFKGKNAMGIEYKFSSKYKCTIIKSRVMIKKISLIQI